MTRPRNECAAPKWRHQAGFTLIEVMITVAIIAILASIALPSYNDYVIRGKLVEGTNALSTQRALMEQYYQDNRRYTNGDAGSGILSPCDEADQKKVNASLKSFTFSCPLVQDKPTQAYTLQVEGKGSTVGFVYTINNNGNMETTAVPNSSWGTSSTTCWIVRKGGKC